MLDPVFSPQVHRRRMTVLCLLIVLPAFCVEAGAETDLPSAGGLGGLLSAPMPGTRARENAELTVSLEQALERFDGVEAANVIVSDVAGQPSTSPSVAVQMTLSDEFIPTTPWLKTIRAFCLRTIPRLDQQSLTVVESSGHVLYDNGEMLVPPSPEAPVIDATFTFQPWWLWIAAVAGFLLVIAGVMTQRALRTPTASGSEPTEPGPLDFLERVPDERIAVALSRERPEVVAAVLALAPAPLAARIAQHEALPRELSAHSGPPDPATTAALARALRERLVLT